jgi:hypothetical protein
MSSKPLEKEFKYFIDNKEHLVNKYNNKYIVIKNEKVIGVYDSDIEAIEKTAKHEKLGTFLVQKCTLNTKNFTQSYYSRVIFS